MVAMSRSWVLLWHFCFIIKATVEANSSAVLQLLGSIKEQNNFNYLLLMKYQNSSVSDRFLADSKGNCLVKSIMETVQLPGMQLDERVNYFLYEKQSNLVLSVVHLIGKEFDQNEGLIKALVTNLRLMTISRVVFIVQLDEANETFLYKLFTYCWNMKLLNVVALFEDYQTTNTFYSYTQFPNFQLEERLYDAKSTIFPDRLTNLYGYNVRFIVGGAAPRIILYYDKHGNLVYRGTLGHFMDVFKQKFNCTVTQPIPANPDDLAPSTDLVAAVLNGTVDISLAITFPDKLNMQYLTYPYEQLNFCLMLPVEPDMPRAKYYIIVFDLKAFLLTLAVLVVISGTLSAVLRQQGYAVHLYEYILHDNCLRGVLGQSFYEVRRASIRVRATYLQICTLGFLLTAWYNSYFSAYVTSTPKEHPYQTYDDILASNLKVAVWESEYNEVIGRIKEFRKYSSMFLVLPSFNQFIRLRDSFDTKYGYMMTSSKWVVVNEQQNIFSKPLFRMRNDFCFFNNVPMGFPVHENSIYKRPIQRLIMRLADTGLISYWTSKGFSELVEAGDLRFLDHSLGREFRAMKLQDLQYVWYGFAFMVVLSSSVWLLELFSNWLDRRRQCRHNKNLQHYRFNEFTK